jgi:hypothetical protein
MNYLEIMFPIDVLRFSEFRTMRNHLSETLMLNDIQITIDYMSRWVVLKRRMGAVTSQRGLQDTFNDLLSNIQKPLGIHHIRTILFSLPVNYLKELRDVELNKGGVDPFYSYGSSNKSEGT